MSIMPLTIGLIVVAMGSGTGDEPVAALRNPGFEAPSSIEGWEVVTYGAPAKVEVDNQFVREGRRALRVSAEGLSDTALGQDVALRPGGWYRFRGWVRTIGLDPVDAPVCGTYQIQRRGTAGSSRRE